MTAVISLPSPIHSEEHKPQTPQYRFPPPTKVKDMATASTEPAMARLPPISTLNARPPLGQHHSSGSLSDSGPATQHGGGGNSPSFVMLPSPNPGSNANPRLRHLVGPLAIHSRSASASSVLPGKSSAALAGPTTPVFIPPLTPRRQPEASPVILDGRHLSRSEPASSRKRTASAAGLPQAQAQARSEGNAEDGEGGMTGIVKQEPQDATIPHSPTRSSPRSADQDSNESQGGGKRRRVTMSNLATIPPHRPALSDPPVSPIVMGFDAQARIDDPNTRDTMLKSLDLKREQEALIQARRAGPARATFAADVPSPPLTSGVAARRGPQAKARNLTIMTPGNGETPSGAKSAPIRPSGFTQQQQQQSAAAIPMPPGTAYPSMPGGPQETRFPPPAAGHHHHHHHHPTPQHPTAGPSTSFAFPVPPTASRAHHPMPALEPSAAPKAAFLSLFETFYDSLADSRTLSGNLDDQLRRSAALLSTLQQSTATFEALLDRRLDEMARGYTRDLQVLEKRLERIENRLGVSNTGGVGSVSNGPAAATSLSERVARVEGVTKHATSGIRGGNAHSSDDEEA